MSDHLPHKERVIAVQVGNSVEACQRLIDWYSSSGISSGNDRLVLISVLVPKVAYSATVQSQQLESAMESQLAESVLIEEKMADQLPKRGISKFRFIHTFSSNAAMALASIAVQQRASLLLSQHLALGDCRDFCHAMRNLALANIGVLQL